MRYTYQMGGRQGVGVWGFEVDAAGDYVLAAGYPQGVPDQGQFVLAVSKRSLARGVIGLCIGIVLLVFGLLGGLALFIVTLVRRIGCKRRLQVAAAMVPTPGGPPAPPMTRTG